MRTLSTGLRRWSEVKRWVKAADGQSVPDFNFNQLLTNLVKGGFMEKSSE